MAAGRGDRVSDFTLEYLLPPPELSELATFFYEFRTFVDGCEEVDRATNAQLRFTLKGQTSIQFGDGPITLLPRIYVLGQTTERVTLFSHGLVEVIGIGILPTGWAALVPIDAALAINQVIDAEALFGGGLAEAWQQMLSLASFAPRSAVFAALLQRLKHDVDPFAREFIQAVDRWLAASLSPDLADLAAATQLSASQVDRNCKRFFGLPPKMLARKYRALRAAVQLAKGQAELGDLVDQGFSDQSHLIREIKHFTGLTPKRFQEDAGELAKLTFQRTNFPGLSNLISGI